MCARARNERVRLRPSRVETAVLAGGAASMGLEILAGRLLAPAFGSSIYVWGSVIGVFLTALSAGYAVGGRTATDRAGHGTLAVALSAAAVLAVAVALGGDAALSLFEGLGLPPRFAPLPAVAALFGPPTFLLGLVSPYAAELSGAESHGGASGRVYAVGTLGSIAGAFGTTFLLVPTLEVPVAGVVLAAVALAGAAAVASPSARGVASVGMAAALLFGAALVGAYGAPARPETVYETRTAYAHLRVADDGGVRTLYLDGVPQSATYVDGREGYVFGYTAYAHLPMLMQDDVDRVLVIGGGGFSMPERYVREYPGVTVDVVELDPGVVAAARRYFDLSEGPRLNVHVGDGRQFLERTNHTYDVVVLDAYRKDRVPFHLTTKQFMSLARERLDEDGVLVANVIAARSGEGSAFYRAMVKTADATFPHVYAFPTARTHALQNIEIVATKGRDFTRAELRERAVHRRGYVGLDLRDEVARYVRAREVPTGDVPVLTDDYAPVNRLLDENAGKRYVITGYNRSTDTDTTRAMRAREPSVADALQT